MIIEKLKCKLTTIYNHSKKLSINLIKHEINMLTHKTLIKEIKDLSKL